jgi:hypothetical protein
MIYAMALSKVFILMAVSLAVWFAAGMLCRAGRSAASGGIAGKLWTAMNTLGTAAGGTVFCALRIIRRRGTGAWKREQSKGEKE